MSDEGKQEVFEHEGIQIPALTTAVEMFNAIIEAGHDITCNSAFPLLTGMPAEYKKWVPTFSPRDMRELAMYLLAYSASRSAETDDEDSP